MRLMPELARRQMLMSLPSLAIVPRGLVAQLFSAAQSAAGAAPIRARTLNHFGCSLKKLPSSYTSSL